MNTIILLGITGDLARRKILPAISQLAAKTPQGIRLIGYSRSLPNTIELENIVKKDGGRVEISFIQGEYDDVNKLTELFGAYTTTNSKTIVYLAIPPHTFMPFLRSVCPLHPEQIDIIIEKPFGQNTQEAVELLHIASQCTLTKSIHFFDHYLFKSSTFLTDNHLSELKYFAQKIPSKITVKALEDLGTSGRESYYDAVGATKDMWQHLKSLLHLYVDYFDVEIDWSLLTIHSKVIGQYNGYLPASTGSKTDTYFSINGELNGIEIVCESGKNLGFKDTFIEAEYLDGTILHWSIDPLHTIKLTKNGLMIGEITLDNSELLDHTRLFLNVMQGELGRFKTPSQILDTWKSYDKIIDINSAALVEYKAGVYPIVAV
jgi:glucose-6-phosphate 1-dehydrogenase